MSDAAASQHIGLVVFDLGRVLVRICNNWIDACASVGVQVSMNDFDPATYEHLRRLVWQVEAGAVSFDEFVAQAAQAMNASADQIRSASRAFVKGVYPGVPELLDQIHAAGIATACLSNTNEHHWGLMSDPTQASFLPLSGLKHRFASHLIGARKPDAAIYEHLERQTGHRGPQILFFDDVKENVEAAIQRGWHAQWIDPSLDDPIPQIQRTLRRHNIV